MKVTAILIALFLCSAHARADSPQGILDRLTQLARDEQAGFTPSAARGEQLYRARHASGQEAESCFACHTADAKARGEHIKTHKVIEPLAPVANRERFTDPAKVEKWFKRNCRDVLNRTCTAQEKADFTAYMLSIK